MASRGNRSPFGATAARAGTARGRSGATAGSRRAGGASSRFGASGGARGSRATAGGVGRSARTGTARSRPGVNRQVAGGVRYGNAYRIHHGGYGGRHHHGYWGGSPWWGGWGWGVGIGWGAGFYVNWGWGGVCAPYYGWYGPRYGMSYGYGMSYYGPAYETVIVEAEPYYGPEEVILEDEVLPEEGNPEDGLAEEAPPGEPLDAPLQNEGADAPQPDPGAADGEQRRGPHADFEPSVKAFLAGDYEAALQHIDQVIVDEPDNGEAWLAVMHANFALGHYGRAANGLAKAAALEAFPRGYRFDPRPLYPAEGKWDELLGALDTHLLDSPNDADALILRAYFHVALGEKKEAQKLIDDVLVARAGDETAPQLAMALLPPPPPPKSKRPRADEAGK